MRSSISATDRRCSTFCLAAASAPGPPCNGHTYLILLDIRLPKIDGIEVLRRIKSDPELRKLPVIMLTTTDDAREVDRCHQLGCSVYIQKPVDYAKFTEAVRSLGLFIKLLLVPPLDGH
jgi:CheY-like chemotaxis protein